MLRPGGAAQNGAAGPVLQIKTSRPACYLGAGAPACWQDAARPARTKTRLHPKSVTGLSRVLIWIFFPSVQSFIELSHHAIVRLNTNSTMFLQKDKSLVILSIHGIMSFRTGLSYKAQAPDLLKDTIHHSLQTG